MERILFGRQEDGREVYIYSLKNESIELNISTRGAAITKLVAFGRSCVAGFDSLEDYITDGSYHGAIIGRVANRIANHSFTLDGITYNLPDNNNGCCLHGGHNGFHSRIFDVVDLGEDYITLRYLSPDMDEGFPSALDVSVCYRITDTSVIISYTAVPDGRTPIALTNHSFFNLDGFEGTVLSNKAQIFADRYTEVDAKLIPTGVRPSVCGTPFDFNTPHTFGERKVDGKIGYDHSFFLSSDEYKEFNDKSLRLAAKVKGSCLELTAYTDQPCMQLYTGNFLNERLPKFHGGLTPVKHGLFCLEAQTEPNCVNQGEAIYSKGDIYKQTTVYEFKPV